VLQCVAVRCSALQCVAVRCSVLQCTAVCHLHSASTAEFVLDNSLQHTATQHTATSATHCNTLVRTSIAPALPSSCSRKVLSAAARSRMASESTTSVRIPALYTCITLQYVAVRCCTLQCAIVCYSVLQCVAVCCTALQCVAANCFCKYHKSARPGPVYMHHASVCCSAFE